MCKTLNNSYLIIGLTGIVLLSLIGVGVFLVLNQETKNSATGIQSTNKSESNTVPTKNDKTIAQTSVVVSLLPQNSVSGTQINKPSENKNIVINVNNQLNGTGIQSTKKPTNTNKNTTSTSVHLNVSVLLGHKNGSKIQPSSERGNKSVVKQGNRTTTQFGVHSGVTNIRDQYNGTRNQTIRTQVPSVGHGPLAKNQTSGMGRPFIEGNRTTTQFGVHSGVTNVRPQYNGTRNQTIKTQAPFLGPGPQPKNQTFRTEKPFIGRNRTQVDTGHSGGQRKYPNGIGQYVPRPPIKPPTFTPYDNRHLSQVPQGGGQSKYPTGIGQYTPKFPIKPPTFTPYNNRHGSQVPQRGGERTYTTHNGQRGSKRRY